MITRQCGACRIDTVEESTGPFRTPAGMFADATDELVASHLSWMAPDYMDAATQMLLFSFKSFVIRTGRLNILVDACVGNDKERPGRPYWHQQNWPWMANLNAVGLTAEDIDIVMCTHLHIDHVGWNTQLVDGRWVPTFPNARYVFSAD
ncbi:MAG: MBL fold metallo-hydrolase, partial [Alphaproteobacteria bacterium]